MLWRKYAELPYTFMTFLHIFVYLFISFLFTCIWLYTFCSENVSCAWFINLKPLSILVEKLEWSNWGHLGKKYIYFLSVYKYIYIVYKSTEEQIFLQSNKSMEFTERIYILASNVCVCDVWEKQRVFFLICVQHFCSYLQPGKIMNKSDGIYFYRIFLRIRIHFALHLSYNNYSTLTYS